MSYNAVISQPKLKPPAVKKSLIDDAHKYLISLVAQHENIDDYQLGSLEPFCAALETKEKKFINPVTSEALKEFKSNFSWENDTFTKK